MAENESLDLLNKASRRWFDLCRRIAGGASDEEVSQGIVRNIHKAFQNVQKQFAEYGVPLGQFISTAVSGGDLAKLVQACDGHDYAHLIELEARSSRTPDSLVRNVVGAAVDKFLHQMEHRVVGSEAAATIPEWRRREERWKAKAMVALTELASKLAMNPGERVRMPPRPRAEQALHQKSMTGMSLVASIQRRKS
jgi:hypothetical protein